MGYPAISMATPGVPPHGLSAPPEPCPIRGTPQCLHGNLSEPSPTMGTPLSPWQPLGCPPLAALSLHGVPPTVSMATHHPGVSFVPPWQPPAPPWGTSLSLHLHGNPCWSPVVHPLPILLGCPCRSPAALRGDPPASTCLATPCCPPKPRGAGSLYLAATKPLGLLRSQASRYIGSLPWGLRALRRLFPSHKSAPVFNASRGPVCRRRREWQSPLLGPGTGSLRATRRPGLIDPLSLNAGRTKGPEVCQTGRLLPEGLPLYACLESLNSALI